MTRVVGKFFIMLLCTFCLLGVNTSYAQLYDGPVGNKTIPNTYEGFDNGNNSELAQLTTDGPVDPNDCFDEDPSFYSCPIDDYVYVLIAIGLGYGFFKFRKMKATTA